MSSEQNSGQEQATIPQEIPTAGGLLSAESLNEDTALALLKQPDLPPETIEKISKSGAMKFRKVKLAVAGHPKTPRRISLPMVRHLFTFDCMQLALLPVVPADVKRAAEESLINRIETISSGERLTLGRRASGRVAGELLLDKESRVMQAALENSRLTEVLVVKAVMQSDASAAFVHAVCHHMKWSLRREIRIALLRSQHTPMAKAMEFAQGMPAPMLREVLQNSRLPANAKSYLLRDISERSPVQK